MGNETQNASERMPASSQLYIIYVPGVPQWDGRHVYKVITYV